MSEEKMRDEFDSWIERRGMSTMKDGETYYHNATHVAWQAWKASRAALAVEQPAPAVQAEPVEDALHARAMDLYRPPFRYDSFGGYIWDSENNMVADNHDLQDDAVLRIRGWGRILYMDDPEALQDKMGELVAAALTAYWTQPAEQQPDVTLLLSLLSHARCNTCDGSGWLYDNHGHPHQCQWCHDRSKALAAHRKGGDV